MAEKRYPQIVKSKSHTYEHRYDGPSTCLGSFGEVETGDTVAVPESDLPSIIGNPHFVRLDVAPEFHP